jgi:RES domain-containing protein
VTPLPPPLGSGELIAWRLDHAVYKATWDSGEGAFQFGGRWNRPGTRAVYCALDPATAILEVAVHIGFEPLDTVPHVLTALTIVDPTQVHIVQPDDVPNPNWLRSSHISAGQQAFGSKLLETHPFILIPSVVSSHSWNLVFTAARANGAYSVVRQEPFALDPRLHPPAI